MNAQNLLDHPPVRRALADPATRNWLRDLLASAAARDPVDVLADLDAARDLVSSYFGALVAPFIAASPPQK
jgi:hypothetical protein